MTREEAIAEITRRLVDYYQPVRIYLFGSVARGDDDPDSDLDFLVVVPDDIPVDRLRGGGGLFPRFRHRLCERHRTLASNRF